MINKIIWLSLPATTRGRIAKDFGLRRSGETEVADNRVLSDGYDDKDLMEITQEKLEERVGRTQKTLPKDFFKLWEYYVSDISEEEIKYSTDNNLNEGLKAEQNLKTKVEEIIDDKEHKIVSKEVLKKIVESKQPKKKMGRPKGSKTKVDKNKNGK
jgi:hypothetical protein